jgi:hypothetical protein
MGRYIGLYHAIIVGIQGGLYLALIMGQYGGLYHTIIVGIPGCLYLALIMGRYGGTCHAIIQDSMEPYIREHYNG